MSLEPTAKIDPNRAWPAARWVPLLAAAGVDAAGQARDESGVRKNVGRWLAARVGREFAFEHDGRTGTAALRSVTARANEKRYYLEVRWDPSAPQADNEPPPPPPSPPPVPDLPADPAPPSGTGNAETW